MHWTPVMVMCNQLTGSSDMESLKYAFTQYLLTLTEHKARLWHVCTFSGDLLQRWYSILQKNKKKGLNSLLYSLILQCKSTRKYACQ